MHDMTKNLIEDYRLRCFNLICKDNMLQFFTMNLKMLECRFYIHEKLFHQILKQDIFQNNKFNRTL